ncbi:MAG: CHAT domain-containing protein, partial [Pyrinomonadaceae bacterium]
KSARLAKDRARIARAEAQLPEAAASLSRMVLSPVAAQLGTKRLLVVSDGALQYVPFAALPKPASSGDKDTAQQPLMVKHEIVSLPSASTLAVLRRELAGRQPAAGAVAVSQTPSSQRCAR